MLCFELDSISKVFSNPNYSMILLVQAPQSASWSQYTKSIIHTIIYQKNHITLTVIIRYKRECKYLQDQFLHLLYLQLPLLYHKECTLTCSFSPSSMMTQSGNIYDAFWNPSLKCVFLITSHKKNNSNNKSRFHLRSSLLYLLGQEKISFGCVSYNQSICVYSKCRHIFQV